MGYHPERTLIFPDGFDEGVNLWLDSLVAHTLPLPAGDAALPGDAAVPAAAASPGDAAVPAAAASRGNATAPVAILTRPRDCVLGGVCRGLAAHLGWAPATVRWLVVGLSLCGGAGILLYLWLWALTPLEPADVTSRSGAVPPRRTVHRSVRVEWLLLGIAGILAVVLLVLAQGWRPAQIPVVAVCTFAMVFFAFAAVAWDQFVENRELSRQRASTVVRVTSGVFLLVMAMLLSATASAGATSWAWPLLTLVVVAGLVVLFGPWAPRLWRELLAERTARVREEQRAEIAAHLHDSVLQTLALIQNRAGASMEVARLARAQERELRD